jgi:hypothetical protein
MAALPHVEGQEIVISAKDGRPGRKAQTRVRQEIEAPRPRVGFDVNRMAPTVKLNAARVEEIDPPAGVKPIVWLLLTTHPVKSLGDEQVFLVMKSQGFDLEDSQVETPEAMARLALAVLIAALRTMQLVNARSGTTGQKLADAMDEAAEPLVEILTQKLEGKTGTLKLRTHTPRARSRA